MKPAFEARSVRSLLAGLLLALTVAGNTLAAAWNLPVTLDSEVFPFDSGGGLVTVGNSTAVAAYSNPGGTHVRRSTDSGTTWDDSIQLSASGSGVAITGRGSSVDVVWSEGRSLYYARSSDWGATFGASVAIHSLAPCIECVHQSLSLARGPGGLVAVAWTVHSEGTEIEFYVMVSHDGGHSFREPKLLAFGVGGDIRVAIGGCVVYVAYPDETYPRLDFPIVVRRSLDAGASWTGPQLIAKTDLSATFSIAAAGDKAYVAWTARVHSTWIRYRRTTNRGATWSSGMDLTSRSGNAREPVISLRSGVVRLAYAKSLDSGVRYRASADGATWTRAQTVSNSGTPLGVGFAGNAIVIYRDGEAIYARARTP